MTRRRCTIFAALVLLFVFVPGAARAQGTDTDTFHACYVPDVGAMYLIQLSGLPSSCLASDHVEVSWSEGGGGVTDHGGLDGLGDDDHPQYLVADGVREALDGFAVTGSEGTGSILAEGPGTRLVWYPGKAAFRAGQVTDDTWDAANVGRWSVAMGYQTTADGDFSTAIGRAPQASAAGATAMGNNTFALGGSSTALGLLSAARADQSTAIGNESEATAENATAIGDRATASGGSATAIGDETVASGLAATALGDETTASGNSSTALGKLTTATGTATTALGLRTEAQALLSVAIGRFNTVEGSETGWLGDDPLLVAGNGSSTTDRSNALELEKDGDLTIAGTLTSASDARLKTGIRPLEPALERLRGLRPVRFRFREDTGHPASSQIGLVAQDVKEVFPELVTRGADGYLSLAYPKLTAVLVRALQEQADRIDEKDEAVQSLRERAARLEARNERISERLDRLEERLRAEGR